MPDPAPDRIPNPQSGSTGGPPRPPKKAAQGSEDDFPGGRRIEIPDPVVTKDLAAALKLKPFEVISDLMELNVFVSSSGNLSFEIASKIARKRGFDPHKVP
jgi:hypothetical protein